MLYFLLGAIVFLLVLSALVEHEYGSVVTFLLLTSIVILYFVQGKELFLEYYSFIKQNSGAITLGVLGYILVGFLYSFAKWYEFVKYYKTRSASKLPPQVKDEITSVARWVSYWPFGVIWFLLNEPISYLINKLSYAYDSIARRIYESA